MTKKHFLILFKIGDKVLISNDFDTTKNPKLVPNWKGPGKIIDINDTRHEQYCLKIFAKRDKLEWSSTEGPFNEILTDR
jgi:hypothetical protein